jgi:hypothetical protein
MENMFNVLVIVGLIIFVVVRLLIRSGEDGKKQRRPPVTLPEDDEEWEYNYATLSAGVREQQPSGKQTKKQTKAPKAPAPPPVQEEPNDEREFDIRSAEEVRRAIIWSEILNRKY